MNKTLENEYQSKDFKADDTTKYVLRGILNDSNCSISIVDNQEIKHIGREQIEDGNLEGALAGIPLLDRTYSREQWLIKASAYTLFPSNYYDDKKEDVYISLIDDVVEPCVRYKEKLDFDVDIELLSLLRKDFFDYLQSRHGATFQTPAAALIRALKKNRDKHLEHTILIAVGTQHFHLLASKGNALLFSNTFEYSSMSDMMYYIKALVSSFNISLDDTQLCFFSNELEGAIKEYLSPKHMKCLSNYNWGQEESKNKEIWDLFEYFE